jgi:glutamate formiminotransferase / 5-formyltetrahydrofolate cyclo-ligase
MLLAVPNVSEGRDAAIVSAIGAAFATGADLLDTHSDADHNRTVFTLVGEPGALAGALLAGARKTVDEIDIGRHDGLHPAIGALDVCPVVWLADSDREAARREALAAAERVATEIEIPVFLYGELATAPERRERAFFRRGGLEELARRLGEGELAPDLGPARLHPTAGAILAAARPPLVAFNLELDRGGIAVARAVASGLREADGGLPAVRAIGLELSGGRAQVSVNVQDPQAVPLARVVSAARRLAAPHGAAPVAAELIGLTPAAALEGFPTDLPLLGFDADHHLIERRLASFQ